MSFDYHQLEDHYAIITAGTRIFSVGDPGESMYILLKGIIYISLDEHLLDTLHGPTMFGEMALVDAQTRSASATAQTECKLIKIDAKRFEEINQAIPSFGLEVMRIMSIRTRRLIQEEIARNRLEKELAIGRDIQQSLLPNGVPEIEGWEFAAVYQTAEQVGGDLYDFIYKKERPDQLHVVLADVTGKGVSAALFMATMRSTIRTLLNQADRPNQILNRTNRAILEDTRTALFLSALCARIDLTQGAITLANGGHDLPLWYRVKSNQVEPVDIPGTVLGVVRDLNPAERTLHLEPGESLLLYTDGITEARNPNGQFFDDERLHQIILANHAAPAHEIAKQIVHGVEQFADGRPPTDDLTLVVIKRKG